MPVAEALKAVGALDEEDLRGMIISRLLTTRLHFTAEPAGTITFDRPLASGARSHGYQGGPRSE
jgi:hypothetical protein